MVLAPALRLAVMVTLAQVSQLPVPLNASSSATSAAAIVTLAQVSQLPVPLNPRLAATTVPLTLMSIGRFVVVPLAWRKVSRAGPAAGTFTVHCTYEPTTLS